MHLVKIRQNHSIKDLTQSKVIGDIKLPRFFVFSEFLRHFGCLNLMKTWEAWWGLLNSTKTYPVLKLNASFQIIRPANSGTCDISQLEVGTISFSHFLSQTCASQSNFSHFWPNLSKRCNVCENETNIYSSQDSRMVYVGIGQEIACLICSLVSLPKLAKQRLRRPKLALRVARRR